jgi:hypothetical protein
VKLVACIPMRSSSNLLVFVAFLMNVIGLVAGFV